MDILRLIAERKIQEAVEQGELDDLPLRGRPIRHDMADVPEEDRVPQRVLKNANVLPEELQLRQQMREIRRQLASPGLKEARRAELVRELNARESQHNLLLERRRRR